MKSAEQEDLVTQRFEVALETDVCYGHAGVDFETLARPRPLLLDIYRPVATLAGTRPAIVFAFGGAFHRGSKETDLVFENGHQNTPVSEYCREFAKRGYVCFSIDYRLTPEDPDPGTTPFLQNPMSVNRDRIDFVRGIMGLPPSTPQMIANAIEAAIDDMISAIAWVHSNAATLGVDPRRIVAAGFSAGAIAALAATYSKQSPVAAAVALSGAMGIAEMRFHITRPDQPPAILFRGENDLPGMGPISQQLQAHMRSVGTGHLFHVVKDGTHFYPRHASAATDEGTSSTVEAAIARFLSEHLVAS